jgi:hypothetical protein
MVDVTNLGAGLSIAAIAAALAALTLVAVLVLLAVYIYSALAWMTIGKRLKYKYPWLAWIPVANIAMILEMGGFSWLWVFLLIVPVLGWLALMVFGIIACWRIFEKRKYPGWLALIPLIGFIPSLGAFALVGFLVVIGLVAWRNMK